MSQLYYAIGTAVAVLLAVYTCKRLYSSTPTDDTIKPSAPPAPKEK